MDLITPEQLTIWRQVVELDVWLIATDDGEPVVITLDDQPADAVSLAFLDRDVAAGIAPPDAVLLRTTLWSALRATPADVAVLLQPGQADEQILLPDDIDQIIGEPRDRAPVLSPRDLAITSMIPASIVNGTVVPSPDGTPVGLLLGSPEHAAAPLTLAAGPSMPVELDAPTVSALVRAARPFPTGFDIVVGAPKPEEYPAVLDFRDRYEGAVLSTVGVIVERVSERIVLMVDSDDQDELARLRGQLGSLVPLPVFVLARQSSPSRAWELGRAERSSP
ncbi:hypothetical protein ACTJKO_07050 [Curtobacterium sp. 22159]|uniref:hypothetical protein n=1 Tax=Curtobacterium sp. 22159 TaxID=3453882 RepID=UPI003F85DC3E